MKVHEDREAFKVLLETIQKRTGYRTDVLEKDYYVVLILEELAKLQSNGLAAYFKGGTALYKALKTTNRFSEDIDLSVETRGCSRTQNDKILERATKKYTSLKREASLGHTNRSEVTAVYLYDPVVSYDVNDTLQRFGKVKVEATSFTISEPVEPLEITPMIYELANVREREILENNYNINPFTIETITLARIFIDKLFAAEAYVRQSDKPHRAFEAAKHIYDLVVMLKEAQIEKFISDKVRMSELLSIRLEEELQRLDGIPKILPVEFMFFDTVRNNVEVRTAYDLMQRQYVLRDEDIITFDVAMKTIHVLKLRLLENSSWTRGR